MGQGSQALSVQFAWVLRENQVSKHLWKIIISTKLQYAFLMASQVFLDFNYLKKLV